MICLIGKHQFPRFRVSGTVLFLLLLLFLPTLLFGRPGGGFRVTAVQFEVREEYYTGPAAFEAAADEIIQKAVRSFSPHLIVFPEYTSAFLALTDTAEVLENSASVEDGIGTLRRRGVSVQNLHDFFYDQSEETAQLVDKIWGRLAKKYHVYIIGGSYFHGGEKSEKLYNRLVVYGPEGRRIYQQDKVYLTEFETDRLSLSPGNPERHEGFYIDDTWVVFTICRDTYFDDWDKGYRGADLWIDLKANGAEYDEEARKSFKRALPVRLEESRVPRGITVCLVGEFLDLFWEGRTSFIQLDSTHAEVIKKSRTWDRRELLNITLEKDN